MSHSPILEVGAKDLAVAPRKREITAIKGLARNEWKGYQKILFRFVFIYFIVQAVPLDWKYYRDLFSLDWTPLTVVDFFYLARYVPRFISDVPVFGDWAFVAVIAALGTALWSVFDRNRTEYNDLYYALRVVVRYRLALALLAYGFIKFYPIMSPEPSLSNLNTNYGDLTAWKIFSMSLGIVPGYQSFLGLVEIFAALLLLHRKTASIGAFIILPLVGNIFMSNLAYEGGEYVYSLLLITFALFLFAYDFQRLARLTSFEKPTAPNRYKPVFDAAWKKYGRLALKGSFIVLFVFVLGYKARSAYQNDGFVYPSTPGLAGLAGIYNVEFYRVGANEVQPSATDPNRWRDVVFETWNTISVRLNTKEPVLRAATTELYTDSDRRDYEYTETSGRKYYTYTADTLNHVLTLRTPGETESISFNYSSPDPQTILLSGTNGEEILLRRIDKKYLLKEAAKSGRRRGLKL